MALHSVNPILNSTATTCRTTKVSSVVESAVWWEEVVEVSNLIGANRPSLATLLYRRSTGSGNESDQDQFSPESVVI